MRKRFFVIVCPVTVLLLCLAGCNNKALVSSGGKVPHRVALRHPGASSIEPKIYTLYQLIDDKGFPVGYSMIVDSVVCMEKDCQVINVRMFWDALGGYQRYELEKGKVLEKGVLAGKDQMKVGGKPSYKGVPFTDADYRKLDSILKDDSSILRTQRLSNMSAGNKDGVDAVTGATPIAMKQAVVEGASLTCFQLWHWANGEVVEAARELTHLRCSEEMLHNYLLSGKSRFVLFALEHLKSHRFFGTAVVKDVNTLVRGGKQDFVDSGLVYLKEAMTGEQYNDNLASIFNEGGSRLRVHLLKLLESEQDLPGSLFDKMSAALPGMTVYYELHLFLDRVEEHEYTSQTILTRVAQLLENDNFFIARKAFWFLEGQKLDEQMKKQMQAFRDKSRKEGRILN